MADAGRDSPPQALGGNAKEELKAFVERRERLEEEKRAIGEDIETLNGEVKAAGFSMKEFNQIIRERQQDADARAEHEAIMDTYRHALGMLSEMPLGAAAIEAAKREAAQKKHGRAKH
jgi:uncharacterized protein (UPF0335 family)